MQRPTPERRTAMIYDKLENIGRYKGMNKHLDTAIDYILHNDLSSLPSGRTELDGDNVYINVMEAAAGPLETRKYEIQRMKLPGPMVQEARSGHWTEPKSDAAS